MFLRTLSVTVESCWPCWLAVLVGRAGWRRPQASIPVSRIASYSYFSKLHPGSAIRSCTMVVALAALSKSVLFLSPPSRGLSRSRSLSLSLSLSLARAHAHSRPLPLHTHTSAASQMVSKSDLNPAFIAKGINRHHDILPNPRTRVRVQFAFPCSVCVQ